MDGLAELLLLALVQGLTEFLPVSSSGHLVLVQTALGEVHAALAVDVALHLGTLLSVLAVYRRELARVALDFARGKPRELLLLALGTLPAAAVGLVLRAEIEQAFRSALAAGLGLLATAAILCAGEWGRRRRPAAAENSLSVRAVLLVGLAQAVAILPGVSRSGTTIAAGLLLGLSPRQAARLSFLLSIPAVAGAAVLTLADLGAGEPDATGAAPPAWEPLVCAIALAALVGWGALRFLLSFLDRGAFAWFAAYTALLGAGALILV